MKSRNPARLAVAACVLLAAALHAAEPAGPEDLQRAYDVVYRVMKNPTHSGALVVDFGPGSPAPALGIARGDTILTYNYRHILSENDLRNAVSGANARADQQVPVTLLRGTQQIHLNIPPGPLGITVLDVNQAIPAALNPPPTPAETYRVEWEKLPTVHAAPGEAFGHELWTRLYRHGACIGYEHTLLDKGGDNYELIVETTLVDGNRVADRQICDISFSATDGQKTPPFVLDTLGLQSAGLAVSAARHGATVRGTILEGDAAQRAATLPALEPAAEVPATQAAVPATEPEEDEAPADKPVGPEQAFPTLPAAVPVYAVPTLAAALPHRAGIALACPQVNELDLHTRLAYTLETLGRRPLKVNKTTVSAWAVRWVHFGKTEQTFFFDDQRQLLFADLGTLTLERVADEASAKSGFLEGPPQNPDPQK